MAEFVCQNCGNKQLHDAKGNVITNPKAIDVKGQYFCSECLPIETQFISYTEIRNTKRPAKIQEIAIDCVNDERYFIDSASINTGLSNALSDLSVQQKISLLIHPNSNTIVEFSTESGNILAFDETIRKLSGEATGFLFLGLFMYFCSLVGLYYTAFHLIKMRKG